MTRQYRIGRGIGAVLCSAMAVAMVLAGQAAAGAAAARVTVRYSWRTVLTARFGEPRNRSGFDAVLAHPTDTWVFGGSNFRGRGRPVIEHRVDGQWQLSPLPPHLTSWITAASAASPDSVWAVGRTGGYVLNWSGTSWAQVKPGGWRTGSQFTGISAITKRDVWVFGASGRHTPGAGTWNYFRGHWVHYTGVGGNIYMAGAASQSSIWAIAGIKGSRNTLLTYDYKAKAWHRVRAVGNAKVLAGMTFSFVLAQTADSVWLTGTVRQKGRLRPKLVHWNGKQWVRSKIPDRVAATDITTDGKGGIWVVANPGRGPSSLLRRSAKGRWSSVRISSRTDGRILAVAAVPGAATVWGAGTAFAKSGRNAAVYKYGAAP